MKSDYSLSDLKTIKCQNCSKKSSQIEVEFFLIVNFALRPELVFVYWEHQFDTFCSVKGNFESKF